MLDESHLAVGRGWVMRAKNGTEQHPDPREVLAAGSARKVGRKIERRKGSRTRAGLVNIVFSAR
jgi:hypothetical protein